MGLLALLWHCSLKSAGLGPDDAGPAGAGAPSGGEAGDEGSPGVTGSGGSAQGQGGAGGGRAGSPGAGGVSGAGAGVGGGAGSSGAAGAGGGGFEPCLPDKGEFELVGTPGACFFFLAEDSKAQSGSKRDDWTWDEASDDCGKLGGALASPSTPAEYEAARAYIAAQGAGAALPVDDHVWLGGFTTATYAESNDDLASRFAWVGGDDWAFDAAGVTPWNTNPLEPSYDGPGPGDADQRCVEMRNDGTYGLRMNNVDCGDKHKFALCERPRAPARAAPR